MPFGPEVAGEVARAWTPAPALATPIQSYAGQADRRVEGQADDRAALGHQRQAGGRQRLQGVRRDLHGLRDVLPRARRGTCRRAASRGCRRRSSARRRRGRRRARGPGRAAARGARRRSRRARSPAARSGSRLAMRLVMPSARPKLEISTVAPCSWATLAVAKPMEVSIVTPATRMRLPSRIPMCHDSLVRVVQWPMPRPPSTGMTAPVTYAAPSEASQVTAPATSRRRRSGPAGSGP